MVTAKKTSSTIAIASKKKLAEISQVQHNIACNVKLASHMLAALTKKSLGLLRMSKVAPVKSCSVKPGGPKRKAQHGYYNIMSPLYSKSLMLTKKKKRKTTTKKKSAAAGA
jgi:hypothetical protein